jgi:hypothetical protein
MRFLGSVSVYRTRDKKRKINEDIKEELNIKDNVDNYMTDLVVSIQRMGLQEFLNYYKYINLLRRESWDSRGRAGKMNCTCNRL